MSTCADAKTTPVTAAYADGHARAFGERQKPADGSERRVYVMRCSTCDGVQHDPGAKLYCCPKCKGWTMGSVDAAIAPPPEDANAAKNAPVMVDRFYEGASIQTVNERGERITVDLGSRQKHREFMRQRGLTTVDDYNGKGGTWERAEQKREAIRSGRSVGNDSKARREAVERAIYSKYKP